MFHKNEDFLVLTEKDIARNVRKSLSFQDFTDEKSEKIVQSIFGIISQALEKEGRVNVRGFGALRVSERKVLKLKNPRTGRYFYPVPRWDVVFKYSSSLVKKISENSKVRRVISLHQEFLWVFVDKLYDEWETCVKNLPLEYRFKLDPPFFCVRNIGSTMGMWKIGDREITMNTKLAYEYSWVTIRDVLRHETAHQVVDEALEAYGEPPHGKTFKKVCELLEAKPKKLTIELLENDSPYLPFRDEDKIRLKLKKYMILSESHDEAEAREAISKVRKLIVEFRTARSMF